MFSLVANFCFQSFFLSFFITMSLLNTLLQKEKWQEFLDYKFRNSNQTKTEEIELKKFVENNEYLDIAKNIVDGTYVFSIPTKKHGLQLPKRHGEILF